MDRNTKAVLPLSSVRDITAIIFLLLALPCSLSCVLLATYLLVCTSTSSSGRFIAAKFISKQLIRGSSDSVFDSLDFLSESDDSHAANALPVAKADEPAFVTSFFKSKLYLTSTFLAITLSSILVFIAFCLLPRQFYDYITLFAKTIIASELIGSSSITSTTVTSITTVTANGSTTTTTTTSTTNSNLPPPPPPSVQPSSSTSLAPSASSSTSSSLTSSNVPLQKKSHESVLRNNKFINSTLCFLTVVNINYVIREWIMPSEIRQVFPQRNHNGLHLYSYYSTNFPGVEINDNVVLLKTLKVSSFLFNYVYLLLSIHVIVINLSPTLKKYFTFEDQSSSLDSLSMISPQVPLLKSNHQHQHQVHPMKLSSAFGHSSSVLSINGMNINSAIINVEPEERKLIEINVNDKLLQLILNPFDGGKFSASKSVVSNNFEIFCTTPLKCASTSNANLNSNSEVEVMPTQQQQQQPSKSRSRSGTINNLNNANKTRSRSGTAIGNSTTIVNKVHTSVMTTQPLWSLIAATKTILCDPTFFSGQITKYKNNGGEFVTKMKENLQNFISMSIIYIDDTKCVFKVLEGDKVKKILKDEEDVDLLKIKLNNVEWIHKMIFYGEEEDAYYVCIYGLTPLFQYEYELFTKNHEISLNHGIFNTNSSSAAVLNQSPGSNSSLLTLQLSLISTIDKFNQSKLRLKKFKKEESKKHSELKKDIENLRNKISKYSLKQSVENRSSGKLKGLKHSVLQLEMEIDELKDKLKNQEVDSINYDGSFHKEEVELNKSIKRLSKENDLLEDIFNKFKKDVKNLELEITQLQNKTSKLNSKKDTKIEELNRIHNDIKNIKKNEILQKSSKRNKRYQERYESILPNLSKSISELQRELGEILSSN